STPATPVTPAAQRQEQPTPTGTWKHPKFDEITRRQYATTFDERNIRAILVNGALLFGSFAIFSVISNVAVLRAAVTSTGLSNATKNIPLAHQSIWLARLLFVANVVQAILPIVRRWYPDEIADIPLTPSQRQSMGLDPNVATPQTPGSAYASPNYVTPPRYQKSTPRSSFSNSGESPLSGSRMAKSTSNSPFSQSTTGSPLFQKAMGGGSAAKRLSYGGSPLGSSLWGESSSSNTPGTP
ncbi:hypothetical protein P154DRAFT_412406, partial [Amniculicola lignicola CBS 123094]